jgi:hypothetical protein
MDAYACKPFQLKQLIEVIQRVMEKWSHKVVKQFVESFVLAQDSGEDKKVGVRRRCLLFMQILE